MIRHIVMFKLKEFDSPSAKMDKLREIKAGLESLIDKIDILRTLRVDFNVNSHEPWDFVLTAEFDSLEDLEKYAAHPDHVAISKNSIGPVKADRACIDYEY